DEEVTWEDQQNINAFRNLNDKLESLETKYDDLKREKEYLDDLSTELELADEDELIKYKIGDTFISLPVEKCQSRIESEQAKLSEQVEAMSSSIADVREKMTKLKAVLYAKFGKSINLEK
ncbi:Prefoldin beta-like protein, partial [Cladochytrium replicatum]